MNLLFVADVSIANIVGGAERCLYEQSTRLSRRGHNVHVLTRRLPEHNKSHESIDGVNEWRYDYNQRNPVTFFNTTLVNAKKLFEHLHSIYEFEWINFHQPFSAWGINQSEIATTIPKYYTCHSLSFEEFSSRNGNKQNILKKAKNFLEIQARKRIERSGLNKSDEIIVLSDFTGNKLVHTYNISRHKIRKIVGGVDMIRFFPVEDKQALRRELDISQNKVVLFTVRNLVRRMGLDNLIIATNELIKSGADIYLVIGGSGALEDELVELTRKLKLEDRVQFAGFIPDERLPLYYQMADLFILPTVKLEGFGLVTLEALASGLPVIGTPIGGTKEILGKLDADFLFEDTQSESIAKLTLDKYHIIKNNPQHWKHISDQCRKYVENHYSWEKNVDSFEALFLSNT